MKFGELLLEIGCEEIPGRFVASLSEDLLRRVQRFLGDNRIDCVREARAFYTSRRLVVFFPAVAVKQADVEETLIGPPKSVGFDLEGKPTQSAISFARKYGVSVETLSVNSTSKGEYIMLKRAVKGSPTHWILKNGLGDVVLSITLPRTMYWLSSSDPRFIRPIRWMCCLYDHKPIGFKLGRLQANRFSFGHRILSPKRFAVRGFEDYWKSLRRNGVILDPEDRRGKIRSESKAIVSKLDCNLIQDKGLLETHVCLSEHPRLLVGAFSRSYLKLPQEILVTVMRDHQKYFSLVDSKGKLLPRFVAVIDNTSDDKGYIRRSHERVLQARFADAEFFWESDMKMRMEDRGSILERIVFQEKLGSYKDKADRVALMADWIKEKVGISVSRDTVQRAAGLCKCDLTTQMVKEFPELQGVVGGLYARAQGEDDEVATAIYEQYQPESFDSPPPSTLLGSLLSISDKMDSLTGSFSLGYRPSGSKDPFGLRRLAYGIINVILHKNLSIDLKELALHSLILHMKNQSGEFNNHGTAVLQFLREHSRFVFGETLPVARDEVNAVMSGECWDLCDLRSRVEALNKVRKHEDFDSLAASFKRIKNIIRKSGVNPETAKVQIERKLLEQPEEQALDREVERVRARILSLRAAGDYAEILRGIAGLRPFVDLFFEKVLVNAQDENLRRNRFNLLLGIYREFIRIADFSELQSATGKTQ